MNSYDVNSVNFNMTAPCGISCANCECHTAKNSPPLLNYLIGTGIPAQNLPCDGCRTIKGACPVIGEICQTYLCVKDKGVNFCYECMDYPCEKLNPAANRAEVLPHNLKVFNLCVIKNRGLDKFAEEAGNIKTKYYKGTMAVGRGPQVKE